MTRVFVTGGSGIVGGALLRHLAARGDEAVALMRSEEGRAAVLANGAYGTARADLFDTAALSAAMTRCEVVYHVAGVNENCVRDPAPMMRVNVDGAVSAVQAAARAGARRIVLTSSSVTIGEAHGTVGAEDTEHRGHYLSDYERSKTEGERAAAAAAHEAGIEIVVVNPSSVQGPGRSTGTGRFLIAYLDGRLKVFVRTFVSLVDIDDCAEGHILAAERGTPGERYLLNGIALPITEALALAADVAGVSRRPRMAPRQLALVGASVVEGVARLTGRRPPVCREMVRVLLHGHHYDGSRATRELGLQYTAPEETLRKTVDWARETGLLRAA